MFDVKTFCKIFLIIIPAFSIPNLLWFLVIADTFYFSRIEYLYNGLDLVSVFLFHIFFSVGLAFFSVYPSLEKGTYNTTLVLGAFFSFFTYAIYGLANQATVINWSPAVTFTISIWGALIGGFACVVTLAIYNYFNKQEQEIEL